MKKSLYLSLDKSFNITNVEANHTDVTSEWKEKLVSSLYTEGRLNLWRTTPPKDKVHQPVLDPFKPGTAKSMYAGKTGYTHIKLSDKERVIAAESFTLGNLAGKVRICVDDEWEPKSQKAAHEDEAQFLEF